MGAVLQSRTFARSEAMRATALALALTPSLQREERLSGYQAVLGYSVGSKPCLFLGGRVNTLTTVRREVSFAALRVSRSEHWSSFTGPQAITLRDDLSRVRQTCRRTPNVLE